MQLGVTAPTFANDSWKLPVSRLENWVTTAESHGFAGAWVFDHLVKPSTYQAEWLDPFVALSTIANATSSIPIGTDILILPLRNPVIAAKQAASVQHVSEGRLTLGMGLGYLEEDFAAANVSFRERSPRFTESLELLQRLLTEDSVTFEGDFFEVDDVRIEPQTSRPVGFLGGGGGVEKDDERVVVPPVADRICSTDGWIAGPWKPDVLEHDWNEIASYAEENGQNPAEMNKVVVNMTHVVPNADTEEALERQKQVIDGFVGENGWRFAKENYILGSVEDIRQQLAEYERLGFDEVILGPCTPDMRELDRQLDLWNDLLLSEFP